MIRSMILLIALLLLSFTHTVAQKNDTSVEVTDLIERVKKAEEIASQTASSVAQKKIKEAQAKMEEVKNELDRAVQSLNTTLPPAKPTGASLTVPPPLPNLQSCTALDCNNRGACLGTRTSYFCACQYGFSGRSCEETLCDSIRDCNGRGICIGTSSTVTCLCNIGFGGPRCETAF